MSEAATKLSTYALLGQFAREAENRPPEQVELQLAQDGWQVYGGEVFPEPVPIPVARAYEIAQREGRGSTVLDETRKHCGTLRLHAKSLRGEALSQAEATLSKLRSELEGARKLKPRVNPGERVRG